MKLNSVLKLKDVGRASAGVLVVEEKHRRGHRYSLELHLERNRMFMGVRLCLACALFLTLTSFGYAQTSTLGSRYTFQPHLPPQSAAPVPNPEGPSTRAFEHANPFFVSLPPG